MIGVDQAEETREFWYTFEHNEGLKENGPSRGS
jgi:hypothetical protein